MDPGEAVTVKINKMKKSQLRNIIRESIKELINEQLPPGACTDLHEYRGYNSSTFGSYPQFACQASGLGILSFGPPVPMGLPGGNNAVGCDNNLNTYQWLGSPQQGEFVGVQATAPYGVTGQTGDVMCWEYMGTVSNYYGINQQQNPIFDNGIMALGVFPDCQACDAMGGTTPPIDGCTDPTALNFDPNATQPCTVVTSANGYVGCGYDDPNNPGSWISVPQGPNCCCVPSTPQVEGCMDPSAMNFDPNAQMPCDGMSPTSPPCMPNVPPGPDCCCDYGGGNVYGCMNPNAMNYDPSATMPCDGINPNSPPCMPNNQPGPDCCCDTMQQIDGCMDSNAFNYDPNATTQSQLIVCDYGFRCKEGWKPGIGNVCGPGNANNPGNFATKQDCIESGCEGLSADKPVDKDIEGGDVTQDLPYEPDMEEPLQERFKKLANIKKK